jgi:integrase/recombinase XerC
MRGRSDGPALARQYLDALRHQRRLSPATLTNYAHALQALFKLLKEGDLALLDAAQVRRFVAVMHSRGLGPRSLALMLSAWRGFYHWLVRHHGFGANPVVGVRAPKAPRPLPKALSVEAAQRLLDEKPGSPQLMRDAAMFELMYSSGLRLGELIALNADDGRLDLGQGEVTVTGKGSKTRTVPVGAKAREALKAWIASRAQLAAPGERALFVGGRGRRIAPTVVRARLRAGRARGCAARAPAHAAPLVRHPRPAVLAGPARRAGDARPRQHLDHPGLHASRLPGAGEGVRRRASARAQEDGQMHAVLKKGARSRSRAPSLDLFRRVEKVAASPRGDTVESRTPPASRWARAAYSPKSQIRARCGLRPAGK